MMMIRDQSRRNRKAQAQDLNAGLKMEEDIGSLK